MPDSPPTPPRSDAVFWRFWTAGTASGVGSAVTLVALPLVAVVVLDSPAWQVGLLAAAGYAAWIVLGLPAGVIVQRLPLRGTQVAMDLIRAVALVSVPLAWWTDRLTMSHLVLVALVIGFADVLFDVGNATFLPALVPHDELQRRNSLVSGTHAVTQLGGPSLGGILVQAFGAVAALVVDAMSYVVSAALMRSLPERVVPRPAGQVRMRALISEGWRYVTRHHVMLPCMVAATTVNFACGALLALTSLHLVRDLHAPPAVIGLLIASEGIGSLVGAAVATRVTLRYGTARGIVAAGWFAAASSLLIPLGNGPIGMVLFALGNAGFAAGVVVLSITTRTFRQIVSPPELLSRVMATVRFVSWGAIPIGSLVAGAVATVLDVRAALWLVCAAAILAPVLLASSEVGRRRDLLDPAPVAAT